MENPPRGIPAGSQGGLRSAEPDYLLLQRLSPKFIPLALRGGGEGCLCTMVCVYESTGGGWETPVPSHGGHKVPP